ncbi:MAG: hypothetical protein U9N49_09735 [Campylobacterota bacterium]|nr:hypothetical protein [Campylobacterota bacterium]
MFYIANFLALSAYQKRDFFDKLESLKSIRVVNQKVVLDENALIIEFAKGTKLKYLQSKIESFLGVYGGVEVKRIKRLIEHPKELTIVFENGEKKIKIGE